MRIKLLSAILLGCTTWVCAQNDIQVDPITGRGSFTIPIGQISVGSLSASLAAVYDGGGVPVRSGGGTMGVGWNLSAGGRVIRNLKGLPDEYNVSGDSRVGWLNSASRSPLSSFTPTENYGCTDWSSFSGFTALDDTEPDIFEFSAPGLSGKFVYDNSGTIRPIPYQDIKIVASSGNFEITTNQGIKYVFSVKQSTVKKMTAAFGTTPLDRQRTQFNGTDISFTSVWYLASMTGPAGEQITFVYADPVNSNYREFVRRVKSDFSGLLNWYYVDYITDLFLLDSIKNNNGSLATINWVGGMIQNIHINSFGKVQDFNFNYTIVTNSSESGVTSGYSGSRSYLTSVVEVIGCNRLPAYTFDYYHPELLPAKNEYPVDFFGYYNAATFTSADVMLIPSVYGNTSAADGERYRLTNYSGSGATELSGSTTRNVNGSVSHYGSMKKINFPAGGFAQITYEPNQYYDDAAAVDQYGAGIRVASVKTGDGDADTTNNIIRNYEYKKSNGKSSGHWLYSPSFVAETVAEVFITPDNLAPDQTILYDRMSIIYPGNGKTVSEFLVPGVYPQTSDSGWDATRVRSIAHADGDGCADSGTVPSGFYIYPFVPNTNFEFGRGLISKVQDYNETGDLLRERNFSYQTNGPTGSAKGMQLEFYGGIYYYGLYSIITNTTQTIQTESVTVYDMVATSNSTTTGTDYTYNGNHLLSEIATTNSDGKVSKVKYKYANDYSVSSPSGTNATMIKKLQDLNRQGTVIEAVKLVDDHVMGADLSLFDDWSTDYVFLKQQLHYTRNSNFTNSTITSNALVYDTAYVVMNTIEGYNSLGMPVSAVGLDHSVAGMIYSDDKATAVATIGGARSSEVVFSDFENSESYQIISSNSSDPWTGSKAYQIPSSGTNYIQKTSITKASAPNYRFRCRAKASGSGTLTVGLSNTSSGWNTMTINYGASGQWVLLDTLISMSTVSAPFTFKLTAATHSVIVDDIAFYPENSSLQSITYTPFAGKTSQTSNQGYSTFYEYDSQYRPYLQRNTDKNVVLWHEYRYKGNPGPKPLAAFFCSGCDSFFTGSPVTFTAMADGCIGSGITYAWTVNGTSAGTGSTLNFTPTDCQEYDVTLTATHSIYGSNSATSKFLVLPSPFSVEVTGDNTELDCDDGNGNGNRTMYATAYGCGSGSAEYQWYFKKDAGSWTAISGATTSSLNYNCNSGSTITNYIYFKCIVTGACGVGIYENDVIYDSSTGTSGSNGFAIHKIHHDEPCNNQ